MKGHYLMLVLPEGKHEIRREYVQLEREDETVAEATERWVLAHPDMVDRKRNRDKTADRIRAEILERRLCRPTSYWKRKAEEAGLPFPAPTSNGRRRKRGR